MSNDSPAFQFYPKDYLADENQKLMTNQERGCYTTLMCHSWLEGSIPADVNKIAKLCNEPPDVMAQLWLAIGSCFVEVPNKPGRLVNPRLEEERRKQQQHRMERSTSGAKGAKARWDKQYTDFNLDGSANSSANGSAIKEPLAKDSSSSPSSSSSNNTLSTDSSDPDGSAEKPATIRKPTKAKDPKPEPKFGDDARTLAKTIYDDLNADNALPTSKDFFVRQAIIAEEMLKKHPSEEWQAAYAWGRGDPFHRQKMANLRYLGDVVWPQYAKRGTGPPAAEQRTQKNSNVFLQREKMKNYDHVFKKFDD